MRDRDWDKIRIGKLHGRTVEFVHKDGRIETHRLDSNGEEYDDIRTILKALKRDGK